MMVTRFKRRFGNRVAVLHSGLSHGEKYDEWRKIQRGEVKVVVGARAAVFEAPDYSLYFPVLIMYIHLFYLVQSFLEFQTCVLIAEATIFAILERAHKKWRKNWGN